MSETTLEDLEKRLTHLEKMFTALLQLRNPVSQPKGYRSGNWHRRSGNIYQDVALPGSPNAETEPPQHQTGDLPPTE